MSDEHPTVRCPLCSEDVPQDERVACAACVAVHHTGCWNEYGKCKVCGETTPLRQAPLTRPGTYGWHSDSESDVRGAFVSAGTTILLVVACVVFSFIVFLLQANW